MNKREFLRQSLALGALAALAPQQLFATSLAEFTLPALPYAAEALEPHFDRQTMEIHHGKHHAAYVKNLNEAIANTPFASLSIEQICAKVSDKDTKIRNNGGGHYNHSLFWTLLSPKGGGTPTGALAEAINATFGSFDKFKEIFTQAAKDRFGSGWAWLSVNTKGKLFVSSTPNQDNPLMTKLVREQGTPLLALDVWEHAYYLKYQNRRPDYITAFWNVVHWEAVAQRFASLKK